MMIKSFEPPQDTTAAANDPYAGVSLMLSDSVAKCVKHRGSSGSRIVFAEIAAKPCNLFIVDVYIPHSNRNQAHFTTDTRPGPA